jgi:hypothetical protein
LSWSLAAPDLFDRDVYSTTIIIAQLEIWPDHKLFSRAYGHARITVSCIANEAGTHHIKKCPA